MLYCGYPYPERRGPALAYEFKSGYLPVKNKVTRLIIAGGGAGNAIWRQIISDVLEREIAFNHYNNTALGTAYLAGYAVGLYSDFKDLREKWNPVRGWHTPRPREVTFYQQAFSFYRELNQSLDRLYTNHDINHAAQSLLKL
ncbi:FGGY-family carbohydrate kinase [Neomoorella glycerini]|uniref:FGGY-family carbohydrate kinase n=1 Tax=Neomoorella glycerini TaxID=55779 RepID=UPI0012E26D3B